MAGERLTALALTGLALTAGCTMNSHAEKGALPRPSASTEQTPSEDLKHIQEFEAAQKTFEAKLRTQKTAEMILTLGNCAIVDGQDGNYYTVPAPAFLQVPTATGLLRGVVAYDPLRDRFIHGRIYFDKNSPDSRFQEVTGSPDQTDYTALNAPEPVMATIRFNGVHQSLTLEDDSLVDTIGAAASSDQGTLDSYAHDSVTQTVCSYGGAPRPHDSPTGSTKA